MGGGWEANPAPWILEKVAILLWSDLFIFCHLEDTVCETSATAFHFLKLKKASHPARKGLYAILSNEGTHHHLLQTAILRWLDSFFLTLWCKDIWWFLSAIWRQIQVTEMDKLRCGDLISDIWCFWLWLCDQIHVPGIDKLLNDDLISDIRQYICCVLDRFLQTKQVMALPITHHIGEPWFGAVINISMMTISASELLSPSSLLG